MSKPLATDVIGRSPLTRADVRILNRVAKIVAKCGAISTERAAKLTKLSTLTVSWAMTMLGAYLCGAGLWVLGA